jgi:hypothetical protein
MTTSYKVQAVKELRAQKKLDRAQEEMELKAAREAEDKKHQANIKRIEKKLAKIAKGEPVEEIAKPKPKAVKKAVSKPKAVNKPTAKKRGRPKKS